MNKDIEVNLLSLDTKDKSNKKLSTNAKVLLAFATGAIVSFMAVSYNQQPSQQLAAQTTNLANSQQIEDNDTGLTSPFFVQWYQSYDYNETIDYLNEGFFESKSYGFTNSTIRYCIQEAQSEFGEDYEDQWFEINSTLSTIWSTIQESSCIQPQYVEYYEECDLYYAQIENELFTESIIQPRYQYEQDIFSTDKIYIFYPASGIGRDKLQKLTLKALGLEYENLRNDNTRFETDPDEETKGVYVTKYDSESAMMENDYNNAITKWDKYMINLLYCPSIAMEGMAAPLNQSTHIYAFASDKFMYFGKKFFGIKIQASYSSTDAAYAWFAAPWYEDIVDVFPSKNDTNKVFVHTKNNLYTVDKYTITPTLIWKNLPSNSTIVETENGQVILIKAESKSYGYTYFYHKKNVDFLELDEATLTLYDFFFPKRIAAAAYGNTVYFIHRGYLYTYTHEFYNDYSLPRTTVTQVSFDLFNSSVSTILTNKGNDDGYIFIVTTLGEVYKWDVYSSTSTQVTYTVSSTYQNDCGTDLSSARHYSRSYASIFYLSNAGVICEVSEWWASLTPVMY